MFGDGDTAWGGQEKDSEITQWRPRKGDNKMTVIN